MELCVQFKITKKKKSLPSNHNVFTIKILYTVLLLSADKMIKNKTTLIVYTHILEKKV